MLDVDVIKNAKK